MLIFFPSADPASRARLKVKNNSTVRVGRRSAVGEMLLEEVHKETYLLGAYGYQDVFNSSLVAMLLVSHAHFPTSVVILLVKILLSSISCASAANRSRYGFPCNPVFISQQGQIA